MRKLNNYTKKYTNPSLPLVGNPSENGDGFRTSRNDKPRKRTAWVLIFFALFTIHYSLFTDTVTASDKWPGVDESVVEKFAKEHGREAREPFINTDQGDLLLFVFLLAGTAGGFIAGYYWRVLLERKREDKEGDCPRFYAITPPNLPLDKGRQGGVIGTVPDTTKHGNL